MKKIRFIAAIAAIVLAVSVYIYLDGLKKPPVEAPRSPVVVANAAIHSGDIIREDMVSVVSMPSEAVLSAAARTTDEVVGRIASRSYETGEQLLVSQFLKAGEAGGGLSYVVQDGMRAITLPVDAISGVAGMIRPRNRVDLLISVDMTIAATAEASASSAETSASPTSTPQPTATASVAAATGSASPITTTTATVAPTMAHTITPTTGASAVPTQTPEPIQKRYSVVAMQNILVLAVSQNTDANSDAGRDAAAGAGTITLQVTPEQAQKLNLAASLAGSIRLTLRSALDTADATLPPIDESVFYK